MRDPARIDRMIELLRTVWKQQPDTRMGQLVYNLGWNGGSGQTRDPFHVEDTMMEAVLREEIHSNKVDGEPKE